MSQKTIRICDECGAERDKINGWFSAYGEHFTPTFITFHAADEAETGGGYIRNRQDFCSQHCVTLAFQRWLNTGSIRKQETAGKEEQ
jgi:hypothetical protein